MLCPAFFLRGKRRFTNHPAQWLPRSCVNSEPWASQPHTYFLREIGSNFPDASLIGIEPSAEMKPTCSVVLLMACAHLGCSCCEREEFGTKQQARPWRSARERQTVTQDASQGERLLLHACICMRPGAPLMPRWPASLATAARGCCVWQPRMPAWKALLEDAPRRSGKLNKSQSNLAFWPAASRLSYAPAGLCRFGGRVAWASRCLGSSGQRP